MNSHVSCFLRQAEPWILALDHVPLRPPSTYAHACSTGVTDADEASRNCAALSTAGLILKHGDLVYLEPGEVALAVLGALPQQPQLLRAKLEETRRELAVLEDRRRHIERSVARWGSVGGAQERWRGMLD